MKPSRFLIGSVAAVVVLLTPLLTHASVTPLGRVAPPVLAAFEVADDMSSISFHLTGGNGLVLRDARQSVVVIDGRSTLSLDLPGGERPNHHRFDVVAGSLGNVGWLRVEFYSRDYYASIGSNSGGVVQVVTDLPRAPSNLPREAEWQSVPTAVEMADNARAWADLVPPARDGNADLAAVAGAFMAFLDENNHSDGRPLCSDSLPSGQMRSLVANGACYAWCTGQALMFRDLLRTAAFPARRVALHAPRTALPDGTIVQSSEQHSSLEVFDGERWKWIDPTFRVFEARAADGTPLSLRGVFEAMSNPATRNHVEFDIMMRGTASLRTVTLATAPSELLLAFARYITTDKLLAPEKPS